MSTNNGAVLAPSAILTISDKSSLDVSLPIYPWVAPRAKYDGEAQKVELGTQIANACNTDGNNGLEGITFDESAQQFYLLIEKTADGKNAIIFKGKVAKDAFTLEKSFKLDLVTGFRYSDIYLKDTTLYLLRSKKVNTLLILSSTGNLGKEGSTEIASRYISYHQGA
ncbi:MAG: hypothetical protein IPN22_07440 [Bacteroidetes bacterium]|nr:hypothetical protein [Bacteroidota bacterium]